MYIPLKLETTIMKKIFTIIAIILTHIGFSQNATVNQGKVGFGVNVGGAYQQGDVTKVKSDSDISGFIRPGIGFGFTFDYWLIKNNKSPLGLGVRARYLNATSRGVDADSTTNVLGYSSLNGTYNSDINYTNSVYFHNHETKVTEGSLELMLSANKLRAQTGILLYGFGGVGLFQSQTKTDLVNELGTYDYSLVNPSQADIQVQQEVTSIMDGNFETYAENNTTKINTWDPTVGFGIGYDFGPVSLALEHKVSFPRHDNLDGVVGANNFLFAKDNDVHHYTNFGLTFHLFGGDKSEVSYTDPIDPITTDPTTTLDEKAKPPVVEITKPFDDPYNTTSSVSSIAAKVTNVDGKNNIIAQVNGVNVGFTYNAAGQAIYFNATLKPGNNTVYVKGTNTVGIDSDQTTIIYRPQETTVTNPPPTVEITKPNNNPHVQYEYEAIVSAKVKNIEDKENVFVKVNNQPYGAFQFDAATGLVMMNIDLKPGDNIVQVAVANFNGSDQDETVIRVEGPKPIVKINSPADNSTVVNKNITVSASVQNVEKKADLTVLINGNQTSNFTYSITNKTVTFPVVLNTGVNNISIKGINSFGEDQDAVKVIYRVQTTNLTNTTTTEEVSPGKPPVVKIITPANNSEVSIDQAAIRGSLHNIENKSDITFKVNGSTITNFTFNPQTHVFTSNINLKTGANLILLKGKNDFGVDVDQIKVVYKKPVVTTSSTTTTTTTTSTGKPDGNTTTTTTNSTTTSGSGKPNGSSNTTNSTTTNTTQPPKETKPTVLITSQNPAKTDQNKSLVKATVKHVDSKSQIKIRLNGKPVTSFNYNLNSKQLVFNATLNEGINKFTITANNSAGSDSKQGTIEYTPCKVPTLTMVTPSTKTSFYNGNNPYKFEMKANHISSKSEVIIYFNGQKHNIFSYNNKTGIISADLPLKHNENTIKVTLNTKCGNVSKEVKVTYRPQTGQNNGENPVIEAVTPSSYPHSTSQASLNIKANVKHVSSSSFIEVFVNGQQVKNFSFNSKTSQLSVNMPLNKGNNNIRIKAQNSVGITEVDWKVVRVGS